MSQTEAPAEAMAEDPREHHERPDGAPMLPAPVDDRPAFLTRDTPLIDSISDRWITYLAQTVAQVEDTERQPIMKAEIGMFVELCAAYGLDPFAKEAWLAKSKTGKLLVMVGRDGLRKIAQRNGLHVDGDVIHKNDEFSVVRTPDGNRTVAHSYGNPAARGEIIGAWAEVREGGPLGRPMGFFYADLGEYKPANVSPYSPWAKQVSVMILAAGERQAIRQATPLGGLLVEGENESAVTPATGYSAASPGHAAGVLPADLLALVERAGAVDAREWRVPEVAARIPAPTDADYEQVVADLTEQVTAWLAEHEPTEAEVVDAEPVHPEVAKADRAVAAEDARQDRLKTDEPGDAGPAEPETTGNETLDVAAELQKRWTEDAEWRAQVGPLVAQRADIEDALDQAVGEGDEFNAESLRASLVEAEAALDALGVPAGWMPEGDGEDGDAQLRL